jgi:anaerobic magnesium-protoporphyrin IX monomethyl ester cyclase
MSKVLLINPSFNISKSNYETSISVGLLSLASYLDNNGIEAKIIDAVRQENYLEEIEKELSGTDLVGLSVMTMQVSSALEISSMVRKFNSKTPIVWGGVHPTLFPEETVKHHLVDAAVFNEGEQTLLELVQAFESNGDLKNIPGIAFSKDREVFVNPKRDFLKMDDLPLPNWSLLPEEILEKMILIPTHTSRGCPHKCAFCINSVTNNYWRGYPAEKILEGLEVIKQEPYFQNKPMRFWDENFFTNVERARAIIQGMIERGLNIPWETTVRVDYIRENIIDDTLLRSIKESGCYLLSYGGESGSERILKKINKGIRPEQIIYSAKQTLKYGIIPQYSFMVGLPGETDWDIKQTIKVIDQLVKLSPQIQILGPQAFRPYPGSVLEQECVASGWSSPKTLDNWAKLVSNELNYLSPRNFPWVKSLDLVESLEAYVRFGAHTIKSALGSTVKANRLLKLPFILLCQLRWKLKFFKWPWDFKLARKFVTKA